MTTTDPPIARPSAPFAVSEVLRPTSAADAAQQLRDLGADGALLAGGTWIMRGPARRNALAPIYLALDGIDELGGIDAGDETVSVGAMVTHRELGAFAGAPALQGLVEAAARSAFPAVRSVATVAGNIAAQGFAEADLVPALLAADARVELVSPAGATSEGLEEYLRTRGDRPAGELIARVTVPAPVGRRSGFERLTIRGGGEYAVASVAVSLTLEAGVVTDARVAVGSVEPVARLCPAAAAALVGGPLDAAAAERAGREAAEECTGRDGLDAPGWYRLTVLPALLRGAVAGLIEEKD
ncbi:MAG: aerobic carbon-monoxide dehydrogenase medium subunit [Baekduia sp.]|nr:aerobic carbon-monoxide dehydrogenase medium subunit [Baekduia sp.]